MGGIEAGSKLELLSRKMGARPDARRAEVEAVGALLCDLDQIRHRLGAERRWRDNDNGARCDLTDRGEVLQRIVRQLLVNGCTRCKPCGRKKKRVTVWRRLRNGVCAQGGAGTRSVFNNDRLTPAFGQLRRNLPRIDVGRAASR